MLNTLRSVAGIILVLGGAKVIITQQGYFRGMYIGGGQAVAQGIIGILVGCYLFVQCVRQWRDKGSREGKGFWDRVRERVKQNQENSGR